MEFPPAPGGGKSLLYADNQFILQYNYIISKNQDFINSYFNLQSKINRSIIKIYFYFTVFYNIEEESV